MRRGSWGMYFWRVRMAYGILGASELLGPPRKSAALLRSKDSPKATSASSAECWKRDRA